MSERVKPKGVPEAEPDHEGFRFIARFAGKHPPVDVMVSTDAVWVRMAAPGISIDHLRVRVDGRSLLVIGEHVVWRPPAGAEFIRAEISVGGFRRRIELPWEVEPSALRMRALNGIVELVLTRLGADAGAVDWNEEDGNGR